MTVQSDQEVLSAVREVGAEAIARNAKQIQEEPSNVVLVMDATYRSVLMHVALEARAKPEEHHDQAFDLLAMVWRLHEVETHVRAASIKINRDRMRMGEEVLPDEWQRKVIAARVGTAAIEGPTARMAAFVAGASDAPLIVPVSRVLATELLSFLDEKHLVKELSTQLAPRAVRVVFMVGNVVRVETIVPGAIDMITDVDEATLSGAMKALLATRPEEVSDEAARIRVVAFQRHVATLRASKRPGKPRLLTPILEKLASPLRIKMRKMPATDTPSVIFARFLDQLASGSSAGQEAVTPLDQATGSE